SEAPTAGDGRPCGLQRGRGPLLQASVYARHRRPRRWGTARPGRRHGNAGAGLHLPARPAPFRAADCISRRTPGRRGDVPGGGRTAPGGRRGASAVPGGPRGGRAAARLGAGLAPQRAAGGAMSGEDGPGAGPGAAAAAARERRREQLRQWGARAGAEPGPGERRARTVRFERAAEFLAACAGGDLDEARLMLRAAEPGPGADPDPAAPPPACAVLDSTNADGISALHQACIDENLEVVRFLVEQGATVNQADNEGWTPLHVAASCGYLDIARYLLSHGANIAAVNSDGDLPLDLAEADAMEGLLKAEVARRAGMAEGCFWLMDAGSTAPGPGGDPPGLCGGAAAGRALVHRPPVPAGVDVEAAKRAEEELLLHDTRCWLNGGAMPEARHPRTGASALHVAAAKGYIEVMSRSTLAAGPDLSFPRRLLLQAGYDPELRDGDGWTPLHAAAHWGVEDACRLLAEHGGGMDSLTHAVGRGALGGRGWRPHPSPSAPCPQGQRPCDLADEEVLSLLEELAQKQEDVSPGHCARAPAPALRVGPGRLLGRGCQPPTREPGLLGHQGAAPPARPALLQCVGPLTSGRCPLVCRSAGLWVWGVPRWGASSLCRGGGASPRAAWPHPELPEPGQPCWQGGSEGLGQAGEGLAPAGCPSQLPLPRQLRNQKEASQSRGQEPQLPPSSKHRRSSVCRLSSREKISLQDLSKERRPAGAGGPLIRDDEEGEEGPTEPPATESRTLNGGVSSLCPPSPPSLAPPEETPFPKRFGLRKTGSSGALGPADRPRAEDAPGAGLQRSASSSLLERASAQAREPRLARVTPTPSRKAPEPSALTPELGAPARPSIPAASAAPPADSRDRWRSYQMPVRDEESESQRKARSRLMRQSRRSTQGVTLTDLKEAEKVAGKAPEPEKSLQGLPSALPQEPSRRPCVPGVEGADSPAQRGEARLEAAVSSLSRAPPVLGAAQAPGCRADSCLSPAEVPEGQGRGLGLSAGEPCQAGKEQRGPAEGEEAEPASSSSPESSAPEAGPSPHKPRNPNPEPKPEQDELDGSFRELYAELRVENERLREALTETTLRLAQLKVELERATQRQERFAERPALLELERFERRALERKAAELEEELKALSDLRADNQRLKDENAALIRVISKLSK
ncbi:Protein phosphatase 1 regulatory subunit 12C, partial [Galemys pyrenaicus]